MFEVQEELRELVSATEIITAEIRQDAIPKGWKLVSGQMYLNASGIGTVRGAYGDGNGIYNDLISGILWVDEFSSDGVIKYGLNIASADYPGDGSVTAREFRDVVGKGSL